MRNAAWQALIDTKTTSLPVGVAEIAKNSGIVIIKNSEVNELKKGEAGISVFDTDTCFIVYDDTIECAGKKRLIIAHELAHIFSGHPLSGNNRMRTIAPRNPRAEHEADTFAIRLLSPACVLWGLKLHTAEEIAEVCKLDIEAARKRALRMKELYKRNSFLLHPLERKVFAQFEEYINKTNANVGRVEITG